MVKQALRFVVHEHKSKRHHFDFRLEIGRMLKSWAVPKGPSLNPADKRLAVMVPDHPLEYADFEAIIPEGRYGAGPVVVWDKGEFIPLDTMNPEEALKKGKLSFELRGAKLNGAFTLAKMTGLPHGTGKEWLLMKKKDGFARTDYKIETALTQDRLSKLRVQVPPCDTD